MKNSTKDYVKTMLDTVKKVVERAGYSLHKVILFGSRVKNTHRSDSDWDFLIIVHEELSMEEKKKLWLQIYKELRRHYPTEAFDVIVKSMREHEHDVSMVNTISNEAENEGVVLYG